MSDYSKTTNFTSKDALTSGDPNKVIKGSDHDTEYDNIATASSTKSNKVISGTVNNIIKQSASGDLVDSGYSFSGLVGDVTATADELNTLDGITSSVAELNILDGATLDVTELNYVDGVTSSIQTQLNTKGTEAYADALVDDLSGVSNVSAARSNLGLGALSILSSVDQSTIDASSVGQGELKTTTWTGSGNLTKISSAAGEYAFRASFRNSIVGRTLTTTLDGGNTAITVTSKTRNYYWSTSDGSTGYVDERYIQASPPYDLGDGLVGRFTFALIDNATGDVEAVSDALEAPWHYNGPTNILGVLGADGKKYQERKDMSNIHFTLKDAKADPMKMLEYSEAFKNALILRQEITQDIKQADMGLIPHPFLDNDLTGKTVVILDPVSDLNHKLSELCELHDEFSINDLLHDGNIKINNTALNRVTPNGVMTVGFDLK